MFEFSVARKYLTPRWRQLSVSIISMISMLVISLVVWLIVVFFSVTNGLEQRWVQKLTAVTAPVRVIPTQDYYNSYYYLVDSIAASSNYTLKTIAEKKQSHQGDPYNPAQDEEVPFFWLAADRDEKGALKDIVGGAFESIEQAGSYHANVYEVTGANIKLRLLRLNDSTPSEAVLNQNAYVASLDTEGAQMDRTLMAHQMEDIENFYYILGIADQGISDGETESFAWVYPEILQERLARFYATATIDELKTPEHGWRVPPIFFQGNNTWKAIAVNEQLPSYRIFVPQKEQSIPEIISELQKQGYQATPMVLDGKNINPETPIYISHGVHFKSQVDLNSIQHAQRPTDVVFQLSAVIQKKPIAGSAMLGSLRFAKITQNKVTPEAPMWLHRDGTGHLVLGSDLIPGDAVVLPRTFHDVGVRLGDRGYVSFYQATASTVQEQRLPVYVSGFYDPGIVPTSGKLILTNADMTAMIRSSHETENNATTNGINVHFDDIAKADQVKAQIEEQLKKRGIDRYWTVETYREFEFTKPLLDQLQSDKTLFLLIATVIIIVACSNIISMLIIMVNDKKMEIGIMRAMGASAVSIATIFGLCGVMMGLIGSFFGIALAVVTLKNIDGIVNLLSSLQGHNAFNPIYYGDSLPNDISFEALAFVIAVTGFLSLLAGIVPAVKASLLKPSVILRSE